MSFRGLGLKQLINPFLISFWVKEIKHSIFNPASQLSQELESVLQSSSKTLALDDQFALLADAFVTAAPTNATYA
jgi:hypothetical protein